VTPPTGWAHKGDAVEEWIDLRFFRPLGMRLARRLAPTAVSADQVTLAALLLGLVAGHLFLYRSAAANAVGLGLFVVSDGLDSADGQLARLRGTSTRFGRILDGIADNLRFANLYAHLFIRLLLAGALSPAAGLLLVVSAGYSHSVQSAVADYLRQVYLFLTVRGGELDLPEDLAAERPATLTARLELAIYSAYLRKQTRWCARSAALVRAVRAGVNYSRLPSRWRATQAGPVARCALLGQNIRFLLLAVTACVGWPAGFFLLTLGPLNLALVWVLWSHERGATRLARLPPPAAGLVVAGRA
jgi:phosphatidylglycerophosphate synthase